GPATEPSLVTCPTSTTGSPRSLAKATSAAVTERTWVTPPGDPSACAEDIVCTESTMSIPGSTSSTCVNSAPRSLSAARYVSSATLPVRSARNRTCPADSSPVTYSAAPPSGAVAHRCATSSSNVDLPTPG